MQKVKAILGQYDPIEVKHEQGVVVDHKGERRWEDKVFIRLFSEFQEHGYLARLTGNELKVFLSIALRMNTERRSYPSQERIAKDTGLGIATVRRCLASQNLRPLVDRVQEKDKQGKFKRNTYTILPMWVRGVRKQRKNRRSK